MPCMQGMRTEQHPGSLCNSCLQNRRGKDSAVAAAAATAAATAAPTAVNQAIAAPAVKMPRVRTCDVCVPLDGPRAIVPWTIEPARGGNGILQGQ
mmetsp:Transcript_4747/g.7087  ORF Transcript_4747/g.7087 Transcript_4747/m.7087 type:complete len:95 (-) Transcript_4747:53-337(-)